ncbi:DUF2490 domain-containing protein [Croceicoccus sp. Ery15]|uniref:DUF2490 domain-containing protein n=1 Tax=Croceicoccus sp. Ery15 TaxID=1703338 RepID=UPI001E5398AD|nr:DUF2490 domain-containing protein [Croceicoccus sp. Ery15]
MSRALFVCAVRIAALSALLQPASAVAEEQEFQLWTMASAETAVAPDTPLVADIGYRLRDDASGDDQFLIRASADTTLTPLVRLGGGVAHFETGGVVEWRLFERVTLARRGFALRSQFEQRFFDDGDRAELRLRERIQHSWRLDPKTRLAASGEWLLRLRNKRQGGDTGTDQLRANIAVTRELGRGIEATAGYLLIYHPVADEPNVLAHVPQISVLRRF